MAGVPFPSLHVCRRCVSLCGRRNDFFLIISTLLRIAFCRGRCSIWMYLVEILHCGAAVASSSIVKCARHEAFSCSSLFHTLRGVWICTCHRDLRCMSLLSCVDFVAGATFQRRFRFSFAGELAF